jgi:hypothetical protein
MKSKKQTLQKKPTAAQIAKFLKLSPRSQALVAEGIIDIDDDEMLEDAEARAAGEYV